MNKELRRVLFKVPDIRSTDIAYACHGLGIWICY